MGINYYSILNLKKHCTTEDVLKAYASSKFHYVLINNVYYNSRYGKLVSKYSITNQTQDHNLIILCEAFEVLSDQFRRTLYDKYGEEGVKNGVKSDSQCIIPWTYHGDVITTYA